MKFTLVLLALILVSCSKDKTVTDQTPLECEEGPSEVYKNKVEPLIASDRPSSCQKCHLTELSLGQFVKEDACTSMACMISQDLVNLEKPTESQILKFIEKGYEEPDTDTIKKQMIDAEYDGFLSWIEYSATCHQDVCGDIVDPCGTGVVNNNDADVGVGRDLGCQQFCEPPPLLTSDNYGCEEAELTRAFYDHIFPEHDRCLHCHSPKGELADLGDSENWLWPVPTMFGARETIVALEAIDAINYENPIESNVLLKPLDESIGGVEHGGGAKYVGVDDTLYVSFLTWIEFKKECTTQ